MRVSFFDVVVQRRTACGGIVAMVHDCVDVREVRELVARDGCTKSTYVKYRREARAAKNNCDYTLATPTMFLCEKENLSFSGFGAFASVAHTHA